MVIVREEASPELTPTDAKTILIVEDDDDIREFLVKVIQLETPYRAILASNGFEALTLLRSTHPDLLILDNHLPDMRGIEFYDLIHTVKALERLPILLISAYPLYREAIVRHLPFMHKPIDVATMLTKLDQLLS